MYGILIYLQQNFRSRKKRAALVWIAPIKTSNDHLRWAKFGWSWTFGGESCIQCRSYRGFSYDVLAVFGHVQKPGCDSRDWRVSHDHCATSCDIAWHHVTSQICILYVHMFSLVRPSHDVVPQSCDVLRHRTRSHDHRATSYDDLWWLQLLGNSNEVVQPHTTVVWRSHDFQMIIQIIWLPAID